MKKVKTERNQLLGMVKSYREDNDKLNQKSRKKYA